jgi:hypothetical protein
VVREKNPKVVDEIERYLRTGDTDFKHMAWSGGFMVRIAKWLEGHPVPLRHDGTARCRDLRCGRTAGKRPLDFALDPLTKPDF